MLRKASAYSGNQEVPRQGPLTLDGLCHVESQWSGSGVWLEELGVQRRGSE